MISEHERFRRVTGLDSTAKSWDYSGERRLFYLELLSVWGYRTHRQCRTCSSCLKYDVADCENCERYTARLVHGIQRRNELP